MSKIIYGVFEDRAHAEEAIEHVEETIGHHGVLALVHDQEVDEIPIGATHSARWALMAGLAVGVAGATVGALVLGPAAGVTFGLYEFMSIAVAGTIFGIVGGAVSGSSEPLDGLRKARQAIDRGDVVVTIDCDAGEGDPKVVTRTLTEHGAKEAAAA